MSPKVYPAVAAVLIFLAAWTIALLTAVGERDSVALPLVCAASVIAGGIARDWRILWLVVALIPIAAVQPCDDIGATRCEINPAAYAAAFMAPLAAALLAVGVGSGRALTRMRRRDQSV